MINQAYKSSSRQSSQVNTSQTIPRSQSGAQKVNLSQSQRINMANYNQHLQMQAQNQLVFENLQKAQRGSQ
jgi:hypothetical protein